MSKNKILLRKNKYSPSKGPKEVFGYTGSLRLKSKSTQSWALIWFYPSNLSDLSKPPQLCRGVHRR